MTRDSIPDVSTMTNASWEAESSVKEKLQQCSHNFTITEILLATDCYRRENTALRGSGVDREVHAVFQRYSEIIKLQAAAREWWKEGSWRTKVELKRARRWLKDIFYTHTTRKSRSLSSSRYCEGSVMRTDWITVPIFYSEDLNRVCRITSVLPQECMKPKKL